MYQPYQYWVEQFYPFFWSSLFRKTVFPTERIAIYDKWLPLSRYMGSVPRRFLYRGPFPLPQGFKPLGKDWIPGLYLKLDDFDYRLLETAVKSMTRFLDTAEADGSQVLFVLVPMYSGSQDRMSRVDEMKTYWYDLSRERGIPLLDYLDDPMCQDSTLFLDGIHLNEKGAGLWSKRLAQDIAAFDFPVLRTFHKRN